MQSKTNTNRIICSNVALALALAIWSPAPARSAEPADGKMMTEGKMMERCQTMKAQKQKMMKEIKAQDAELCAQVAKMNSAPEDKKLDLMAAVLTSMVAQQAAMNVRKAKMEEEMMQHMMQHMQMGKESRSQCPMMTGMKDMDTKSASAQPAESNAERAFLQAMVSHHEMAIEIAKMAKNKAKNPTLKSMADDIIRVQSDEIVKMKSIHQRLFGGDLAPDKMAHERLGLTMENSGMMIDMEMLGKATNFDEMFVEDMTMHHQGAINMARKVLETTTDEELRKLAEAIIEAQTKEIETLKMIR